MKHRALLFLLLAAHARAGEKLFVATPLTPDDAFTAGIEGPACDAKGNVFAVNFAKQQTIGKVTPDGKGEVWVTLPGQSTRHYRSEFLRGKLGQTGTNPGGVEVGRSDRNEVRYRRSGA